MWYKTGENHKEGVMRKKTGGLIFISLIFFCFTSLAFDSFADDADKAIEKKKAAIMKIMSQGQFKAYIQDDAKFCAAFLEDFKQQKNIEHIKPIVEADDYNDPNLQKYFKRCPKTEFHKSVEIRHAQTLQEIVAKEQALGRALTGEELEEYGGIEFYATKNFKLYKTNIDNNLKNGDEHIFYAEGYKNIGDNYTYGGYSIIDIKNCKKDGGVSTIDPFDYEKQIPLDNYNGIIRYKGKLYVFDLHEQVGRRLVIEKYNKKNKNMNSICEYRKHRN